MGVVYKDNDSKSKFVSVANDAISIAYGVDDKFNQFKDTTDKNIKNESDYLKSLTKLSNSISSNCFIAMLKHNHRLKEDLKEAYKRISELEDSKIDRETYSSNMYELHDTIRDNDRDCKCLVYKYMKLSIASIVTAVASIIIAIIQSLV